MALFDQVARVPVKLYQNENGEKFFYLKRFTFPRQKITKLIIRYGPNEAASVQQQYDSGNNVIMLPECPIECHLEGSTEESYMTPDEYLTDTSFHLPGFKIAAIRIRMYMKQKVQAQQQLSDGKGLIILSCDVECRLQQAADPASAPLEPAVE